MTDIRRESKILREDSSEWAQVKKSGITCLPEGVSEIGERLLSLCKEKGLFIVPVGELESWMDIGTRNKQKWIVHALEKIHDEGPPKAVTDFLNEVAGYLS